MTLTATLDEVERITVVEADLLASWSDDLRQGRSPAFVASLIEQAVDFEPRFGVAMDQCNGCETWVEESARDEHGRLWCSDGCRDFAAEVSHELQQDRGYRDGLDVRASWPADIRFGGV